jgi:NAD-dependent DNA ligase
MSYANLEKSSQPPNTWSKRTQMTYEADGAVIKINDLDLEDRAGVCR